MRLRAASPQQPSSNGVLNGNILTNRPRFVRDAGKATFSYPDTKECWQSGFARFIGPTLICLVSELDKQRIEELFKVVDVEATNIEPAHEAIIRVEVTPEVKWIVLAIGNDVALEAIWTVVANGFKARRIAYVFDDCGDPLRAALMLTEISKDRRSFHILHFNGLSAWVSNIF